MYVKLLEQEAKYFARREFARRQQALVEQASRAAEEERQRVVYRCPAALSHVWCAAGDGHVPQHSYRQRLALSGGSARL